MTPGWVKVFDIDTTPDAWLSWIGQFVGVRPVDGETYAARRSRTKLRDGWRRGSRPAFEQAIQDTLEGTKTVYINERAGGSAYRIAVATIDTETVDVDATLEAILSQKPGGIVLEYSVVPGPGAMTWGELFTRYATWGDVMDHFATWGDVFLDNPTP